MRERDTHRVCVGERERKVKAALASTCGARDGSLRSSRAPGVPVRVEDYVCCFQDEDSGCCFQDEDSGCRFQFWGFVFRSWVRFSGSVEKSGCCFQSLMREVSSARWISAIFACACCAVRG